LIIIGELAAGVRILLEKGLSGYHISEDQQFQENTQKFIFPRKTEVARRRGRGERPGAHPTRWHRPALGCATQWCGRPGPPLPALPCVYRLPENLRLGGGSEIESAASAGQKTWKTHREIKLFGKQKSAREIPSQRGEIITIVITIELYFIGIIMIITTITITFITITITITITSSRYNILG
jgi:hypothetical protein